ncbi:hypothetical protein [Mesorhizobium sp. ES1-4]|uniref:hypothetical protein n=1 Tax=Mesorhizobium sp. ES1-4 TaxID=2876627 RepID=UPI001CCF2971|nr:hypothetical protein [Mesorhizobium sp. ES1-4]MBZ9795579.1 hypothetical protein [Mesorhizobium sp. ES1-4]
MQRFNAFTMTQAVERIGDTGKGNRMAAKVKLAAARPVLLASVILLLDRLEASQCFDISTAQPDYLSAFSPIRYFRGSVTR